MSHERQVIVPFTPYEWKYVRQLFRSRRLEDVKECVIILATWISRTGNNTPVAISCSHVLLQAYRAELEMEGMCESERYKAIDDLRSKHGFAIVRFVNYVNEMNQTTNLLRSMVVAVADMGVEKWVVDIRHAITHQDCPDISELRKATAFCLDWLWENFWFSDSRTAMNSGKAGSKNRDSNQEFGAQEGREQQYVAAMKAFNTWRMKNRYLPDSECSVAPPLLTIKQHLLLDATGFLTCFLRDGHLIQTPSQLKNQKITTSSDETWSIPETLQHFWEPIFHLFFNLKLGPDLVVAFLWRLKEPRIAEESRDQCTAYVRTILEQFGETNVFSDDEWAKILDQMLAVAANFNPKLIDSVMNNCKKLTRKRRKQIHRILNISATVTPNTSMTEDSLPMTPGGNVVHTVEDLQKLLKRERKMRKNRGDMADESTKTGIELCDEDEWIDVPFGMTPGQRVETFTVVIEKTSSEFSNSRRSGAGEKRQALDTDIVLEED